MIDHFHIPESCRRTKDERRKPPPPGPRFVMPAKPQKTRKRKRSRPTEAQRAYLRDAGYTVAEIRSMSERAAGKIIDDHIAPHVWRAGK